jgi:hypothetical protein
MRPNQEVRIVALGELSTAHADMQTTLFVGSRSSSRYLDFMFTPRGYAGKYALGETVGRSEGETVGPSAGRRRRSSESM